MHVARHELHHAAEERVWGDALRIAFAAAHGRLIAHHTGLTHAGVNAELNRSSGLDKVSRATVEQLERRLVRAEQWLRQASSRRVPG